MKAALCVLAGSHVSPRQAQTPRQVASSPNNNNSGSSALLQEQLDRATKAAEAAVFRAAEAESRLAGLSAELETARGAEQAGPRFQAHCAYPTWFPSKIDV